MKIHFDNDNATIEFTFDNEIEKELANKNPEVFAKTISDIKEMYLSNTALAIAKLNNEKEMYLSKNEKVITNSNNSSNLNHRRFIMLISMKYLIFQ